MIIILFISKYVKAHYTDRKSGLEFSPMVNDKEATKLVKGHEKLLENFRAFNKICKKYGLKYWAIGGTLIGAIRHQGWIPWDGDIDIAMVDTDYEKLREVADEELPRDVWLQDKSRDPLHHKEHAKIRDLNTCYYRWYGPRPTTFMNGMCIDIFLYKDEGDKLVAYPNINISSYDKVLDKKMMYPLAEVPFEDLTVYIPKEYKEYSIKAWGKFPPDIPPVVKRFPHEGMIAAEPCPHNIKNYPQIYKHRDADGKYYR